jgi:hypothetical protein
MVMSLHVSHALLTSNEETRKKLVAAISQIRTEEQKHRE